MSGRLYSPSGHELVPVGTQGLYRDTTTGVVGTPGGGFGGARTTTLPDQAVKTAPKIEVPPPDAPPAVTDPGQPYGPPKTGSESKGSDQFGPDAPPRKENPETDGAVLWLRKWKLSIGTTSGDKALDLSELAFEFHVNQAMWMVPWHATFTIHNAGEDMLVRMQKELTNIYLEAGYQTGQYGMLFTGQIAFYKYGRTNATDTFVEIHAVQNLQPHSGALINTWIKAGYTKQDVLKAAVDVMNPWGVMLGQVPDLGDEKSPRGRVLHGNAVDVIRDVAHSADAEVWIDQNGKLNLLKPGEALEMANDIVPILNSQTGLIDVPQVTLGGGVEARCLLNPKIIPGGQVKINQRGMVKFQSVNTDVLRDVNQAQQLLYTEEQQKANADGYYVVVSVTHFGENRGNPWYTDIRTMPYDQTQVAKQQLSGPRV